jgi:ribosomal protein L37AE/L43A
MKPREPIRRKSPHCQMCQELDLFVREKVFERDGWKCVKCGKSKVSGISVLQVAHVYPKGKYQRLRFEIDNLLSLCYACHMIWLHRNPMEFSSWFRANYPERARKLEFLKDAAAKVNVKEALSFARQGLWP